MSINQQAYAWGAKRPKIPPSTPPVVVTPSPPPVVVTPPPVTPNTGPYVDQITEMVSSSSCINYSFKDRGRAPAGYIKGVTLGFARSLCRLKKSDQTPSAIAAIMSKADSNNDAKDALTHYQNVFSSLSFTNSVAGVDPLRADYTLLMGLGMRESSGTYCEGWDVSAGSNRPSSAAEAGLFQTSYDSISASSELSKLYSEYKSGSSTRCFLNVFKEGASCKSSSTLGTGAGADFQVFNKACPAFATEYAATMLRILRGHYGPINRQEAEVVPGCNQLLKNVQALIEQDTENACADIL